MRIKVRVQHFADREALQLQWVGADGRRKTKTTGTADPVEAERQRADLEYELNHGLHAEPTRMTWEAFRELLEREYLPGRRQETRVNYRKALDSFEELCRPVQLASVTTRMVSAFVAGMRVLPIPKRGGITGFKSSTIAVRVEFLRAALLWAVEQGLLKEPPVFPTISVPKKRPQPVPAEAFERVMEKVQDVQLRAFALCGWLAGLRRNEAYALEWERTDAAPWLDLGRSRIVFPAETVKADEDQWVPLDPALREALLAIPRKEGPRVFHFSIRPQSVVRRLTTLAKHLGMPWLTMRVFRRGFGCRYAGKVPAQVLQRLMRHSSVEITMQFYAHIDGAVEEAVLGRRTNSSDNTPSTASAEPR